MVSSPSISTPELVGIIAQACSIHNVQLEPSNFQQNDPVLTTTLSSRSSDPGQLIINLASQAKTLPVSLLLSDDPIALARLSPHLTNLANIPVVLHIETGVDHAPISTLLRSSGLALIYSRSAEDAKLNSVIAYKIAKVTGKGVIHWFDSLAGQTSPVDQNFLTIARRWVAGTDISASSTNGINGVNGHSNGNSTAEKVATSFEHRIQAICSTVPPELGKLPSSYFGPAEPTSLIVVLANENAVKPFLKKLPKETGVLYLRVYQPQSDLTSLVPTTVTNLVILEQAFDLVTRWSPLFLDFISAFNQSTDRIVPRIVSRTVGSISKASDALAALLDSLDPNAPFQAPTIGIVPTPRSSHSAVSVPKHEGAYTRILEATFRDRLQIVNNPNSLNDGNSPVSSTSPEFALGKLLADKASKDKLKSLVRELLANPTATAHVNSELRAALTNWLKNPTDPTVIEVIIKLLKAVPSNTAGKLAEIAKLSTHFNRPSNWIIGSDAWAYDLGSSGVHHTLSSEVDVNLLIIDTQPYLGAEAAMDPNRRGKKDIGLYAMNYGNAYVASVAVYGEYAQTARAIGEADKFEGPSIILAYLPDGDKDATKALEVLQETKRAIDSGYWPLYRWNPRKEFSTKPVWDPLDPHDPFQLDSEKIKNDLKVFLDRQNHLSLLAKSEPEYAGDINQSLGKSIEVARKSKALRAFEALSGAVDGPPLLVLFASDAGNAEKVAKRFNTRARARGLSSRVQIMDDFQPEDLALEVNVALITSTAGQGEFPQNGRLFWKALNGTRTAITSPTGGEGRNLGEVKYSVFAMGDSHYWPRPEDARYYNKPGKDLDRKLSELGAEKLCDLGLGDDQDPDGPQTGYKIWEASMWKALGVDTVDVIEAEPEPITNEHIKIASNFLRGTIAEGLRDTTTGALAESDGQLTKFHGIYQQDDRDIRDERKDQGLEPAYSFMIRVRMPAGICRPEQWLQIDEISDRRGNHTFKLTTRQTFQYHGVIKGQLKLAMQEINKAMLDTIAACGDVNRNVLCTANPSIGPLHAQVFQFAKGLSEHLLPKTTAYAEIWLDQKQVGGDAVKDFEPLYGPVYLPRKFKIAVAVPPHNDVDVFCNDVGFIAIVNPATGHLDGFNVSIGGGMGVTHSMKKTYPRLGDVIGFVKPEQGFDVAEKIMLVQRDNGDRTNRKHARLKYTIDTMGLANYKAEVEKRLGYSLEPARPYEFTHNIDAFGWAQGQDKKWHFTAFIENGRVEDAHGRNFKTCLREIAKVHKGVFRLTANQHVVIADIPPENKSQIEALLKEYKLDNVDMSGLRLSSSACVAFPTCGLAMAESERYLPELIDKVEKVCEDAGLRHDSIVMRMSGCPNGCSRPYAAEVAFVGKAPGQYLMLLGGGYYGQRMGKIYKESVDEAEILSILTPMIKLYAKQREQGERFGDFTIRQGWITPVESGAKWYDGITPTHPEVKV